MKTRKENQKVLTTVVIQRQMMKLPTTKLRRLTVERENEIVG